MIHSWPPPPGLTPEERTAHWHAYEAEVRERRERWQAELAANPPPHHPPEKHQRHGCWPASKFYDGWMNHRVKVKKVFIGREVGDAGVVIDWDDGEPTVMWMPEAQKPIRMSPDDVHALFNQHWGTCVDAPLDCLRKYEKVLP